MLYWEVKTFGQCWRKRKYQNRQLFVDKNIDNLI